MKKLNIILTLLILTIISACKKDKGLTEFDLKYQATFTIPSNSPVDVPLPVPTPDVTTNSTSEFSNNGTTTSLVKEIKLKEITLTITNPSGQNFNFLKSAHIFIGADNLSDLEVAYIDPVPGNVTSLNLTTTGSLLDPYIKAPKFKLKATVVTKEIIIQNVTIKANIVARVKANLL